MLTEKQLRNKIKELKGFLDKLKEFTCEEHGKDQRRVCPNCGAVACASCNPKGCQCGIEGFSALVLTKGKGDARKTV